MKKWFAVLGMSLALLVAGCSDDSAGTDGGQKSTIQSILKNKKLVVGTAPGYFPFDMKDKDGKFVGYDMDTAEAIGKALGVKVEYKQFGFDGLIPALQTGEIDMIFGGMTIRGDRALAVSFSNPYYKTGQALMVPSSDTSTKSWEDLDTKGTKVAVSLGTTGALLAKDLFKNAEVLDFEDFPGAATAMQQGQADAVLYDEPGITVWKLRNSDSVTHIEGLISSENLGIAVRKNDFESIQWLNSFLQSYIESPAELASREKWFENNEWLTEVEEE